MSFIYIRKRKDQCKSQVGDIVNGWELLERKPSDGQRARFRAKHTITGLCVEEIVSISSIRTGSKSRCSGCRVLSKVAPKNRTPEQQREYDRMRKRYAKKATAVE